MLAKYMDRRLLLIVNAVSLLCGSLFMIVIGMSGLWIIFAGPRMEGYAYHKLSCSTYTKYESQTVVVSRPLQPFWRGWSRLLYITTKYYRRKRRD